MISDRPDRLQRTPMKEDIEYTYLEATKVSNSLRNILMCKCPGSRDVEYKNFVTHFGYLFDISHHRKELNTELIEKCMKWCYTPRSSSSRKNIIKGLRLYDEYAEELFKHKLLTYD